jgi:hypothetical protein
MMICQICLPTSQLRPNQPRKVFHHVDEPSWSSLVQNRPNSLKRFLNCPDAAAKRFWNLPTSTQRQENHCCIYPSPPPTKNSADINTQTQHGQACMDADAKTQRRREPLSSSRLLPFGLAIAKLLNETQLASFRRFNAYNGTAEAWSHIRDYKHTQIYAYRAVCGFLFMGSLLLPRFVARAGLGL